MKQFAVKIYLSPAVVSGLAQLRILQNKQPGEENWSVSDDTALLEDLLAAKDVANALEDALEDEILFRMALLDSDKGVKAE